MVRFLKFKSKIIPRGEGVLLKNFLYKQLWIGAFCCIFSFIFANNSFESFKTWITPTQPFSDSYSGAQYLVPADHWVYSSIRLLALESGTVSLLNKSPVSAGELHVYFSDINYDRLSLQGRDLYQKLQTWFLSVYRKPQSFPLTLSVNPAINFAAFYRNTEDTITYPEFDYKKIPPVFTMGLNISVLNYVSLFYDFFVGAQLKYLRSPKKYMNLPLNKEQDATVSRGSYISMGIPLKNGVYFWNFKAGRGGLNIGNTKTPSIILSDSMDTPTYGQLSFFSSNIKYSANITQLAVNKYFYYHSFDFRLFKRFSMSITEGVMVNAPFELTYLNPLEVFHGLEPWSDYKDYNADLSKINFSGSSRVGTMLGVMIEVNPWKYMAFYGLFHMNQFQLKDEIKTIPNALGFQLGFDVNVPIKTGYVMINVESLYTSPYMYKHENKNWSFDMDRRGYYGSEQHQWTGSAFGPDSIMGQVSGGFLVPDTWGITGFFRILVQGSMNQNIALSKNGFWKTFPLWDENGNPDNDTDKAIKMATIKTPSGVPQWTYRLGLEGFYHINRYFKIKGYTGVSYIINAGHNTQSKPLVAPEIVLSCEFFPFGGKKDILH